MNVRAFWEHGIVFQSTDQIKGYDGLKLLNDYGDQSFFIAFFETDIVGNI